MAFTHYEKLRYLVSHWRGVSGEDGQALVEHMLVLSLVALVAMLAVTAIGLAISGMYQDFADAFP